jgi:hypothetical protein
VQFELDHVLHGGEGLTLLAMLFFYFFCDEGAGEGETAMLSGDFLFVVRLVYLGLSLFQDLCGLVFGDENWPEATFFHLFLLLASAVFLVEMFAFLNAI